jgi:hypothetical protein
VNGRGSQKQTAGCSRRRGRISVELDVAMGRQQARNEQAVHYYVGLARDPGRRALGSPEFWARSAKGLPSAGGGLRATALTTPWLHVARRTSGWINARESVDWPGGARCDDTGPECRVPVLCRLCRAAHGPWPTAHGPLGTREHARPLLRVSACRGRRDRARQERLSPSIAGTTHSLCDNPVNTTSVYIVGQLGGAWFVYCC